MYPGQATISTSPSPGPIAVISAAKLAAGMDRALRSATRAVAVRCIGFSQCLKGRDLAAPLWRGSRRLAKPENRGRQAVCREPSGSLAGQQKQAPLARDKASIGRRRNEWVVGEFISLRRHRIRRRRLWLKQALRRRSEARMGHEPSFGAAFGASHAVQLIISTAVRAGHPISLDDVVATVANAYGRRGVA